MEATPENNIRTLVIDDGLMNRRLAERILRHLGCEVVTAEDARAGMEALKTAPIDIVFTDVEMPDLNGSEAVELFRETAIRSYPGRSRAMTIVAVSGQALGAEREPYIAAGFDEYIAKPISVDRLREFIAEWRSAASATEESNG